MKSEQLLTQGKIFEDDILAGPECTNNPAEEVPEPYDHAQNLTGTLSIELGAKSLILRVYDVLMNDNEMSLYWMNKTNGTILGCAAADGRPSGMLKCFPAHLFLNCSSSAGSSVSALICTTANRHISNTPPESLTTVRSLSILTSCRLSLSASTVCNRKLVEELGQQLDSLEQYLTNDSLGG